MGSETEDEPQSGHPDLASMPARSRAETTDSSLLDRTSNQIDELSGQQGPAVESSAHSGVPGSRGIVERAHPAGGPPAASPTPPRPRKTLTLGSRHKKQVATDPPPTPGSFPTAYRLGTPSSRLCRCTGSAYTGLRLDPEVVDPSRFHFGRLRHVPRIHPNGCAPG